MLDDFMGAVAGSWAFFVREPVFPLLTVIVLVTLVCAIQRTRIGILGDRLRAADHQTAVTHEALGASSGADALVRIGELIARVDTLTDALHLLTDRLTLATRGPDLEAVATETRAAEDALDRRIRALDLDLAEVVAYSYAEAEEKTERATVAA